MVRFVCDAPGRIPARIYTAVRRALDAGARAADPLPDCPCCAFWRGVVLGAMVAGIVAVVLR